MTLTFAQILQYCTDKQIDLTTQQLLVLEILYVNSPTTMTSADILDAMLAHNPTANRMTIYRALDYLIKQNLIHKIQANNTYSICQHLSDHSCQILVCLKCGNQIEVHSHTICQALNKAATENQFIFANPLEITGYCMSCLQT